MKYVLKTLERVIERLQKVEKNYNEKGKVFKRDINAITYCIRVLADTHASIKIDLQPKRPRRIEDAITWVTSQSKEGTFVNLMTEKGDLIRTMFVTKDILTKLPEFEITTDPVTVEMKKIQLHIASLDFVKTIPSKTHGLTAITKQGDNVKIINP